MQANKEVTSPVFQYFGGKWKLAPWILSFMPPHRTYVEPFGGGGSVLFRKPRSHCEVYNDLDSEVVNVFQVLRDSPKELLRVLDLTPYSREEYYLACELYEGEDSIEKARRAIVRSFFGFGSTGLFEGSRPGFRTGTQYSRVPVASVWGKYPDALLAVIDRLKGVTIEHRDALEVMPVWDGFDTVYYLDPPYLADTRRAKQIYRHEMTEAQHISLLEAVQDLKGIVLISGYASGLYDKMLTGWERYEKQAMAQGNSNSNDEMMRTEVLWIKRAK